MGEFENIQVPWKEWKIVRDLGHGGFGSVYEIERELFGRRERAAMKVLVIPKDQSEVDADFTDGYDEGSIRKKYEDYRDKVIQEYQLMSEMKGHTNIVNCDDVAVLPLSKGIGWKVYIRMELLTPLEKKLRSETLSTDQIIKLGIDICKALSLCEKKNIVHRDVKPANIMVSEFGDYKLGDFGVARTMDHTTNATSIGTEKYMAPEVIKREKYGKEADLYSLGLVLYWLLNNRRMPFMPTNRIPTQEEVNSAQFRRIRGEAVPDPVNGSAALKQVVKKACAYNPKDRYRSAQEMLEALQAANVSEKEKRSTSNPAGQTWWHKDYLNKEDAGKFEETIGKGQKAVMEEQEDVSKTVDVRKGIRPTAAQRIQIRQDAQKSAVNSDEKKRMDISREIKKYKIFWTISINIIAAIWFGGFGGITLDSFKSGNADIKDILVFVGVPAAMYLTVYIKKIPIVAGILCAFMGAMDPVVLVVEFIPDDNFWIYILGMTLILPVFGYGSAYSLASGNYSALVQKIQMRQNMKKGKSNAVTAFLTVGALLFALYGPLLIAYKTGLDADKLMAITGIVWVIMIVIGLFISTNKIFSGIIGGFTGFVLGIALLVSLVDSLGINMDSGAVGIIMVIVCCVGAYFGAVYASRWAVKRKNKQGKSEK